MNWISVGLALPAQRHRVLLWGKVFEEDDYMSMEGFYEQGRFYASCDSAQPMFNVTHFQMMPKGPVQ